MPKKVDTGEKGPPVKRNIDIGNFAPGRGYGSGAFVNLRNSLARRRGRDERGDLGPGDRT